MAPLRYRAPPPRSSATTGGFLSAALSTFRVDVKGFLLPSLLIAAGFYVIVEWTVLAATGTHLPEYLASTGPSTGAIPFTGSGPIALVLGGLAALGMYVLATVLEGGLTCHAVWLHRGKRATLGWSLRVGLRHSPEVLAATVLLTFALGLISLIVVAPVLLAAMNRDSAYLAFYLPGLVLISVISLYVVVTTTVYVPAIVVGHCRVVESLSRSAQMTRGHRRSLFAALFVLGLTQIPFVGPLLLVTGDPSVLALQLAWASVGFALYLALSVAAIGASYDILLTPWKRSAM